MDPPRRERCVTCSRSVVQDRNRRVLTGDYMENRPGFTEYVMERINAEEVSKTKTILSNKYVYILQSYAA